MGKASRTKQDPDRRARIAAQRAAEKRRQQRNRIYLAGGSIFAVIIVVVAVVLFGVNHKPSSAAASNGPAGAALATLTRQVTGIPSSTLDQVGAGGISGSAFIPGSQIPAASASGRSYFATVDGTPLTQSGKPEILYIGAEYCPFCAAQRWSMISALSRFGTFSGLKASHSSSSDSYPNTPTWTFYGSAYTSKYIAFTPVEETTNVRQGSGYAPLQKPTSAQQALIAKYDPGSNGQGGAIPFIDMGNKYVEVGNLSPYGPQILQGKTWSQVAAAMSQPGSAIGKGADGSANYMTAAICKLTGNQPASACTPVIKGLESKL